MKFFSVAVLLVASLGVVAGCSSPSDGADDDDSFAQEGELRKAKPVWPKDGERLIVWTSGGGGFGAAPPSGSTCGAGAVNYDFEPATRKLKTEACVAKSDGAPFHEVQTTKTLNADQVQKLNASLAQVTRSKLDVCGADKPFLEMTVASPTQGLQTFTDSFYACMAGGDRVYVDNIDQLFTTLESLAAKK